MWLVQRERCPRLINIIPGKMFDWLEPQSPTARHDEKIEDSDINWAPFEILGFLVQVPTNPNRQDCTSWFPLEMEAYYICIDKDPNDTSKS